MRKQELLTFPSNTYNAWNAFDIACGFRQSCQSFSIVHLIEKENKSDDRVYVVLNKKIKKSLVDKRRNECHTHRLDVGAAKSA